METARYPPFETIMAHISKTVYIFGLTPDSTSNRILNTAKINAMRYTSVTMFKIYSAP